LIDQAKGKFLIFARFRADLQSIQDMLGDEAVSYHGGIKDDDRTEAKRRFQNDPKTRFFVGQPRNAGIGHTLTAASHVVFYSNDSSLRFREESEKRAHRMGLKNNLIVWDLIAHNTNDAKIVRALRSKKKIADEIMQDPENYFLQHK
jgi:SNF2 family DNA or RNA helicase